jgi:SWI/SNF-related matrix-associated actin-dependent regulator 1 of chromatin subfamily A
MKWVCATTPNEETSLMSIIGLGKTIQVISFLAHLKQTGNRGPHLIVVPYVQSSVVHSLAHKTSSSSTLENWCREFARFAPTIAIQTYYGEKNDRAELRQSLRDTRRRKDKSDGWEVLITTYNLAQGDERDRHFFRKLEWDVSLQILSDPW